MENKPKRKSYSFKTVKIYNTRSKSKNIENQSTLIGSLLNLMMGEKVLIAIVRIRDSSTKEDKTIPISFKIDQSLIPDNLQSLKLNPDNLINISVPGAEPFGALVVVVADDSKDLHETYRLFLANVEALKLPNFQKSLVNWFNVGNIKIEKSQIQKMTIIQSTKFDSVLEKVNALKRAARGKALVSDTSEKSSSNLLKKDKIPVVELDLSQPTKSSGKDDKVECVAVRSNEKKRPLFSQSDLKKLAQSAENIEAKDTKKFAVELVKVLESVAKKAKPEESNSKTSVESSVEAKVDFPIFVGDEFQTIRIIPEHDKTYEKDNYIYIEGVLPLDARDYKWAVKKHPPGELEASVILNNIIKDAFPKHWIVGVTLRGSAGRKSLISIWNYADPTTDPCSGSFENHLGETRLRALIDHVIRKTRKKSYDKNVEKHLINCLAKSLHYARTRIAPRQTPARSDNFEFGSTHSDFDDDKDREMQDDSKGAEGDEYEESDDNSNQPGPLPVSVLDIHMPNSQFKEIMRSDDEDSTSPPRVEEEDNFLKLPGFTSENLPSFLLEEEEDPNQNSDLNQEDKNAGISSTPAPESLPDSGEKPSGEENPSGSTGQETDTVSDLNDSGMNTTFDSSDNSMSKGTPKGKRSIKDYFSVTPKKPKSTTQIEEGGENSNGNSGGAESNAMNLAVKKLNFEGLDEIPSSQPVNFRIPAEGPAMNEEQLLEQLKKNPSLLSRLLGNYPAQPNAP